jgi:hypothetical protein
MLPRDRVRRLRQSKDVTSQSHRNFLARLEFILLWVVGTEPYLKNASEILRMRFEIVFPLGLRDVFDRSKTFDG